MKNNRLIPRSDRKYGVVFRDITLSYDLAMRKRYGYNWRKKVKEEEKKRELEKLDDV